MPDIRVGFFLADSRRLLRRFPQNISQIIAESEMFKVFSGIFVGKIRK